MEREARPSEARPPFDRQSWHEGYTRGYSDGRMAGEQLGEQALRDQLLSQLALVGCDLRLQLRHDMDTPIEVLHAIALLVQDRKTL